MKVDRVYTRSVVATTRDAPISQAASAMRKFHVGALLVVGEEPEDRDVIGIVTDRDLALRAVADGLLPDDVRVCEVMTSDVIAVREDADLREALERMRSAGVRRLLVQHANGDAAGIQAQALRWVRVRFGAGFARRGASVSRRLPSALRSGWASRTRNSPNSSATGTSRREARRTANHWRRTGRPSTSSATILPAASSLRTV
jgi:predicted transcriptional regulator